MDSKGGHKLNTGSGDVEAAGLILSEKGNFNTGSGDVEVRLDAALQDDISANSGSGGAIVDFNRNTFLKKTARLGTKDIRINVGTGTDSAEIRK